MGFFDGCFVGCPVGLFGADADVGELVGTLVGKGLGALEGTSLILEGAIEGLSVALFVPVSTSAHC